MMVALAIVNLIGVYFDLRKGTSNGEQLDARRP